MKLERVDILRVRMPVIHPYETSYGRVDHADHLILKMYTSDFSVFSESAAGVIPGFSYETLGTAREILKSELLPAVMGRTIQSPEDFILLCRGLRGHPMTKAAVENAFWIIKAMEEGKSLAELIGNERKRIPAGAGVGIQETEEELIALVGMYLSQGYTKIKMKIKPGMDVKRVAAVRKVYPDIVLMVDANSAYRLDDIDTLQALDDFNLQVIEQPLEHDDIFNHAKLQARLKTPIGLDESILNPSSASLAIELKACRSMNIKQCRVGGLTQAKKIHDICQAGGVGVWCGGMMETGIGRAVLLALSGLPNFIYPMDIGASDKYFQQDIVEPAFKLNPDGTLNVPQGPGLGVKVNEKMLDRYTVSYEVIRS